MKGRRMKRMIVVCAMIFVCGCVAAQVPNSWLTAPKKIKQAQRDLGDARSHLMSIQGNLEVMGSYYPEMVASHSDGSTTTLRFLMHEQADLAQRSLEEFQALKALIPELQAQASTLQNIATTDIDGILGFDPDSPVEVPVEFLE